MKPCYLAIILILSWHCVLAEQFLGRVYVINLEQRTDRLHSIEKQLARAMPALISLLPDLDPKVSYVKAVDGSAVAESWESSQGDGTETFNLPCGARIGVDQSWEDPYYRRAMTAGEVGCASSHITVWTMIQESALEYAIILEDDALLQANFVTQTVRAVNCYIRTASVSLDQAQSIPFCNSFHRKDSAKIQQTPSGPRIEQLDLFYLSFLPVPSGSSRGKRWPLHTSAPDVVFPEHAYWLLAYIISKPACSKLLSDVYLNNLFPLDEYTSIMQMSNVTTYPLSWISQRFESVRQRGSKLFAAGFAYPNSIVRPTPITNAQQSSVDAGRMWQMRASLLDTLYNASNSNATLFTMLTLQYSLPQRIGKKEIFTPESCGLS